LGSAYPLTLDRFVFKVQVNKKAKEEKRSDSKKKRLSDDYF
jgi:hypothetical protein